MDILQDLIRFCTFLRVDVEPMTGSYKGVHWIRRVRVGKEDGSGQFKFGSKGIVA